MVGNGRCNDFANNKECGYDGGDCCLDGSNFDYCSECECILADVGKDGAISLWSIFRILVWWELRSKNHCILAIFVCILGWV